MAWAAALGALLLAAGLIAWWKLALPTRTAAASSTTGISGSSPSATGSAGTTPSAATTPSSATSSGAVQGQGASTAARGKVRLVISQPGDGPGGGVVLEPGDHRCVGDCTVEFGLPVTVTLTADPKPGYLFTPWSGSTCFDVTPCTLRMPRLGTDLEVHAGFTKGLQVSVTVQGNGTVSSGDGKINCPGTCSVTYPAKSRVLLHPGNLNTFQGWTGCTDQVSGGGCGVSGVTDGPVQLVAKFGPTPTSSAPTTSPTTP